MTLWDRLTAVSKRTRVSWPNVVTGTELTSSQNRIAGQYRR